MEENDSKGFKISFNDDEPVQSPVIEDRRNFIPEKKTHQPLTAVTIITPMVFLAILAVFYLHFDSKIIGLQNTGATKVESLTETFELKLKDLTSQTDQIKERIEKEMEQLDSRIQSVSGSLGKNKNSLDKTVSEKADKSDLQKTATDLSNKIENMNNRLQQISSDLKAVDSEVNNQLGSLSKKLENLSEEISQNSQKGIGKDELEFELDLQAKRYKTELKQAIAALEKKLAEVQKQDEPVQKFKKAPSKPVTTKLPSYSPATGANGDKKADGISEKDLLD